MKGRCAMADKELLDKIIAMQDEHIMPKLDELAAQGAVPSSLQEAQRKVLEWQAAVRKEDGHDQSYREWPPKQFTHELKKHINLFGNHEGTQWVREYEELVAKLPYDHDREHV